MMDAVQKGGGPVEALIVVDLQEGFLAGAEAVPDAVGLAGRIGDLLAAARAAGALVLHLQNDGPAGAVDEPGTPGWRLRLAEPDEPVLRKAADDGFAGTDLAERLDARGVRRIAICGLLSEMCVSATARSALAHGLGVVLPHDGHTTYDVDDIPATIVSRVAEHALGDEVEIVPAIGDITFTAPGRGPVVY
jgi:nicotinamidase-related amidase